MTDETQTEATEQEPQVTEPVNEPTLDDIISEYNVQAPTQQVATPNPAVSQGSQTFNRPASIDFLDENQAKQYTKAIADGHSTLYSQLNEVKAELTDLKRERAELQIENDINQAVSVVNDGLDLDPDLVRVHLEYVAQKKPGFKSIWDNRVSDPATYKKALNAVKKDIASKYQTRTDQGLAETQAAIRQSQRTLASKPASPYRNSIEERMAEAKSESEFESEWNKLVNG